MASSGGSNGKQYRHKVSPHLARLAVEAREAAEQALEEAREAAAMASSSEEVLAARAKATETAEQINKVREEMIELDTTSDTEQKNSSTARSDATRLRTALEKAQEDLVHAKASAEKLATNFETVEAALADAVSKMQAAEEAAATKWEEASAASEVAKAALTAAELATTAAEEAQSLAQAATARRLKAETRQREVDQQVHAAKGAANETKFKKEECDENLRVKEEAAGNTSGSVMKNGAKAAWGNAKDAWEMQQLQKSAEGAVEAAQMAELALGRAMKAFDHSQKNLAEAVEAEGPLKETAERLEGERVAAQQAGQKAELDSKSADAVARKAEQAARVARSAHQAAASKHTREGPVKETADKEVIRCAEAVEAAQARCETADQKEKTSEVKASETKQSAEAKHREYEKLVADSKALDALATELESKEQVAKKAAEHAAALVAEAEAAEARQYETGMMTVCTATVAGACTIHGPGLLAAQAGQRNQFTIVARDEANESQISGGDSFFVRIRYCGHGTRVRAHIEDHNDGTYTATFTPKISGRCAISVSLLGEALPGSPFMCHVRPPLPCASQCLLSGSALEQVTAGEKNVFGICFRDESGTLVPACELDVWVQPISEKAAARHLAKLLKRNEAITSSEAFDEALAAAAPAETGKGESSAATFDQAPAALDAPAASPAASDPDGASPLDALASGLDTAPSPAPAPAPAPASDAAAGAPSDADLAAEATGTPAPAPAPAGCPAGAPGASDLNTPAETGGESVTGKEVGAWDSGHGKSSRKPVKLTEAADGQSEVTVVCNTPLDMTVSSDPTSKWLGKVTPGQVLRVLRSETVFEDEGPVTRALVALGHSAERMGDQSWRSTYAQRQDWRTPSWRAVAIEIEKSKEEARASKLANDQAIIDMAIKAEAEAEAAEAAVEAAKAARNGVPADVEEEVTGGEGDGGADQQPVSTPEPTSAPATGGKSGSSVRGGRKAAENADKPDGGESRRGGRSSPAPPDHSAPAAAKSANKGGTKKGKGAAPEIKKRKKSEAEKAAELLEANRRNEATQKLQSRVRGKQARGRVSLMKLEHEADRARSFAHKARTHANRPPPLPTVFERLASPPRASSVVDSPESPRSPPSRYDTSLPKLTYTKHEGVSGWVTLSANEVPYTSKPSRKITPAEKQRHRRVWAREMGDEKELEIAEISARDHLPPERSDGLSTGLASPRSPLKLRLEARAIAGIVSPPRWPPSEFACSGVASGAKARSQVIESHDVHFAIGSAGKYLLHVSLRPQSAPVHGSPFVLSVVPGSPNALLTQLALPLRGGPEGAEVQSSTNTVDVEETGKESHKEEGKDPAREAGKEASKEVSKEAHKEAHKEGQKEAHTPKPQADAAEHAATVEPPTKSVPTPDARDRSRKPSTTKGSFRRTSKESSKEERNPGSEGAHAIGDSADGVEGEAKRGTGKFVCKSELVVRDRVGNPCGTSGCNVVCGFASEAQLLEKLGADAVSSSVEDLGRGVYQLTWRVAVEGNYPVFVKLEGMHVLGSPAMVRFEKKR